MKAHPEAHCWAVGMTNPTINKILLNLLLYN